MNEIKCPNCKTGFTIDEAQYADILHQIRTKEFAKEIEERLATIEQKHKQEIQLAQAHVKESKEKEISDLKTRATSKINEKDLTITQLTAKIEAFEKEKQYEVERALSEKNIELKELSFKLESQKKELEIDKNSIKERYELQLKLKDEEIAIHKDYKTKQSTKMLGESLEQHCETEFNRLRPTTFLNATFGKDNDASSGSKGDYIYRELDQDGEEIVSIMFEMKNEGEETATKKKNEHFFKELDKDRNQKKCEYAVLVSRLEADSDLYNDGIVDVSYHYEKMYVIRPQFFIPIITLLRNAAMKSLQYKKEIRQMQEQNIDITNFEKELNDFRDSFGKRYVQASERFADAIKEIDKSIAALEKTKKALTTSEEHLRIANNKSEDLTIKKLTRNNPTMKAKFESLEW